MPTSLYMEREVRWRLLAELRCHQTPLALSLWQINVLAAVFSKDL